MQFAFDNCIKETIGQERPEMGYFSKIRTHDTHRPKPKLPEHKLPPRLAEISPLPEEIDPQAKYIGKKGI